eukprot:TRINITY_DN24810_c0_g1_i1.p2 TRINITY_DN24810_c0_g1~~TRINITY_DN24810_c0_g1_i1.p2  ORF type:complete len:526 (+),score=179.90 TRINITY_DN24810_c0_g1_i1:225-1580(+)
MHTPNLAKLAGRSLVALKSYVQQAVCSPSRTSMLTSRRPDRTRVYDLESYWRDVGGNFTTLPQYFLERGYRTIGTGKIFHPGAASNNDDRAYSWTHQAYFHAYLQHYKTKALAWRAVNKSEADAYPLPDTQVKDHAVEVLANLTKGAWPEENFFLAVGFHKPHLPFIFPEEYLEYYPEGSVVLPPHQSAPKNMPAVAWTEYGELLGYEDQTPLGTGAIGSVLPAADVLALRRAYYAAVSYMDGLVGEVVDALDASPFAKNTVVAFWGDHGWQLGEHGEWAKHTNFELATRAPVMIAVPGLTDGGVTTSQFTELLDVFPTVVEAALGEPMAACPPGEASRKVDTCTEGTSLLPLATRPDTPVKRAAFSQYPRYEAYKIMGYSVVTALDGDQVRFTKWCRFHNNVVDWDTCAGTELYNHTRDVEENFNVAGDAPESVLAPLLKMVQEYAAGHA